MAISKSQLICAFLGIGGLTSVITIPTLLLTRKKREIVQEKQTPITPKKVKQWPKDYEHNCHKWIIEMQVGELMACQEKSDTELNPPLFFYLWWLKEPKTSKEYNTFVEVDQIKAEGNKEISFVFKNANGKGSERKLKVKDKYFENLSNLNGVTLKDSCKVEGKTLSCKSNSYTAEIDTVSLTFWVSKL